MIFGSAAKLHRAAQTPITFAGRCEFDAFRDPAYEKLFMSLRVEAADTADAQWLILEHATKALSKEAERKFRRYWSVIKPAGAFVSRQLLKAIRRRADVRDHHQPALPEFRRG
jgi:hypothetical protein